MEFRQKFDEFYMPKEGEYYPYDIQEECPIDVLLGLEDIMSVGNYEPILEFDNISIKRNICFTINYPYLVRFNNTHYYFLNRHYKNLGNPTSDWMTHPELDNYQEMNFYNTHVTFFDNNEFKSHHINPFISRRDMEYTRDQYLNFVNYANNKKLIEIKFF